MEVREPSAKYLAKSGYQQTEVGSIPGDWLTTTLGNVTTLMTNGFVGTATTHYANNENGVLYVQGYNVEENSFNFHGIKFVTEAFHRAHMKSCLRNGDLLTVQTGDVGLTTIVTDALEGANCHALIISRFDAKRISSTFIAYYLNSIPGRSRLRLIETGTTMKHLNVGDMLQFSVPIPPTRSEQEAIAEALCDADALIESLEQLLAKKRNIKQGAMQELLTGRKRLPNFREEWESKTLGEIADIKTGPFGSSLHERDYVESGTPIITVEHLGEYGVLHSNLPRVSDQDRNRLRAYALRENDIVFSRVGSIDRNALIRKSESDWLFSGRLLRVRADEKAAFAPFLSHYFQTEAFKERVRSVAVGQTMASLSTQILRGIAVTLPNISEQISIATILSSLNDEIVFLDSKLTKARQIKQGMMRELLTGRIRLV